jgi:hypothetical protein
MVVSPEAVSFWADIAAIFIVINVLVIVLVVGAAFGAGWWYLRKGRKALAMPLLMGQVYTLRVQHITMRVTDGIANAVIQTNATATQVTTTARVLGESLVKAIGL